MRFWLAIFVTISLLSFSTGCQSFRDSIGAKKPGSLLGIKRRGPKRSIDSDEVLDPLGARDGNRLLLDDLAPSQVATTFKIRMAGADSESAQLAQAPSGEEHKASFDDAANKFRLAAAMAPDSEIEEDALFFEGESYFFADRYVQANRAFEKLIANYSGSKHLDKAEHKRYSIAVYWLKLADNSSFPSISDPKRPKGKISAEARRVLHRIRIDDPSGKLADDATLALGKAFMKARQHYDAADTFEDLRNNYPASEHQFTAHMLELEARLNGYQGKDYDDTPLRKADELMKQIVRLFPQESGEQLEYLEQQAALIQNQIAERDYTMGQYFENRGENRAAGIYYRKIANKYDNTELGETINQQIEKVAALPDKPKQVGKWLINVFPNPEPQKPVIRSGDNESLFR
jgi:outer membrane protein assembly factor BamD (BamD/ComL family)